MKGKWVVGRPAKSVDLLAAAGCVCSLVFAAGCGAGGSGGGGGGGGGGGLAAIEGDWLYILGEGDQVLWVDCITIAEGRVRELTFACDGNNRLVSAEDIVRNGREYVLAFRIEVEGADDSGPVTRDITTTLTQSGDVFVGTERIAPPEGSGEPEENLVGLRRPQTQ